MTEEQKLEKKSNSKLYEKKNNLFSSSALGQMKSLEFEIVYTELPRFYFNV